MAKKRMKPGVVRDAIESVLRERGSAPMADIMTGVEAALGSPVPASSVRSYLNLNEGKTFTRIERGHYRLKKP